METYLASNIFVAEAHNQTVLWGVVFVLVLNGKTKTCIVIGFTFTTPLKLDLKALKVLLILHNFHKPLKRINDKCRSSAGTGGTIMPRPLVQNPIPLQPARPYHFISSLKIIGPNFD